MMVYVSYIIPAVVLYYEKKGSAFAAKPQIQYSLQLKMNDDTKLFMPSCETCELAHS